MGSSLTAGNIPGFTLSQSDDEVLGQSVGADVNVDQGLLRIRIYHIFEDCAQVMHLTAGRHKRPVYKEDIWSGTRSSVYVLFSMSR